MNPSVADALLVDRVSHAYGQHTALREMTLRVESGQIFALLGPNGCGKTTLFRLIATLARLQAGDIRVLGHSVSADCQQVRSQLGIVFQAPSLDPKLTVEENLRCQGALYGLSGQGLAARIDAVLSQLGVLDRRGTPAEELSGGLKRRVELAKSILHRPPLLLMDEPSTGLDPAARLDLWHALRELQDTYEVTVILTTHLLEEAEKSDCLAIMNAGCTVAVGRADGLRAELGGHLVSIQSKDQKRVKEWLRSRQVEFQEVDNQIRITRAGSADLIAPLSMDLGEDIQSISLGQPSLEDVFIAKTGHQFWQVHAGDDER